MNTDKSPDISALVTLLEDEDRHVASLAMEQILMLDRDADALVADLQESANPVLRHRIHQLGNVLNMRRSRRRFIKGVENADIDLWDGILQINYQYNPRFNQQTVDRIVEELRAALPRQLSGARLAAFMRGENFSHAREDVLGADLYLIEDVLVQRVGSPILLSAVAQHLGREVGWQSTVVLYKGKHCLFDAQNNLIEPAEGWRISRLTPDHKLHPCADRDIWLTILCQLYLSALLEGRIQAIHRVGTILAKLCGGEFRDLPYPLGV